MWIEFNNNPVGRRVEDCTVRALSKVLGVSWDEAHHMLAEASREMGDMMHATSVLSAILRQNGFYRYAIPNTCPDCYDVIDFCEDNPEGTFVLGTGTHVIAIIDGNYYDMWDSGLETPIFYWSKKVK